MPAIPGWLSGDVKSPLQKKHHAEPLDVTGAQFGPNPLAIGGRFGDLRDNGARLGCQSIRGNSRSANGHAPNRLRDFC